LFKRRKGDLQKKSDSVILNSEGEVLDDSRSSAMAGTKKDCRIRVAGASRLFGPEVMNRVREGRGKEEKRGPNKGKLPVREGLVCGAPNEKGQEEENWEKCRTN